MESPAVPASLGSRYTGPRDTPAATGKSDGSPQETRKRIADDEIATLNRNDSALVAGTDIAALGAGLTAQGAGIGGALPAVLDLDDLQDAREDGRLSWDERADAAIAACEALGTEEQMRIGVGTWAPEDRARRGQQLRALSSHLDTVAGWTVEDRWQPTKQGTLRGFEGEVSW